MHKKKKRQKQHWPRGRPKGREIDKNEVQETKASKTPKTCHGMVYSTQPRPYYGRAGNPNFVTQLSLSGKLKLYLYGPL
jgi:hypothetical protein